MSDSERPKEFCTDETLAKECDRVAAWVANCVADGTTDSWTPHLTVVLRDGSGKQFIEMMALHVPFTEDHEKHEALRNCGKNIGQTILKERQLIVAVVFSAECWRSKQCLEATRVEPRHDPNRTEALMVAAGTIDGRSVARFADVTRLRGCIRADPFAPAAAVQMPLLKHFWQGVAAYLMSMIPNPN